jgi:restriction system protein
MERKEEGLFDLLILCPWWVGVVLSAGTFLILRYLLPAIPIAPAHVGAKALIVAGQGFAPLVAVLFLMPAPVSALYAWRRRRLLDSQQGLDSIRALSWQRFETLVAEAYRRQGYTVREHLTVGPDGGVDLVLRKDGTTVLVQCKQWRTMKVGVTVVRELYGLMAAEHAQRGIIITSGRFTQEAKTFVHGKPLDLVEGQELASLVAKEQQGPTAPAPSTRPSPTAPPKPPPARLLCPTCGAEMVLKTARRGANVGQQFWSCSRFPACRGGRPYQA